MKGLDRESLEWARACLRAGDPLLELAEACEVSVLDLAHALGVDRALPLSLRWRPSYRDGEGSKPSPFVGRLLKEVAVARHSAGEDPGELARAARVGRRHMCKILGDYRLSHHGEAG